MSEDNLQRSVLGFHHVGSSDGTQVVSLGDMDIYLLSHPLGIRDCIFFSSAHIVLSSGKEIWHLPAKPSSIFPSRWLDYAAPVKAPRPGRMRTIHW